MCSTTLIHVTGYHFGKDQVGADQVTALLDDSVFVYEGHYAKDDKGIVSLTSAVFVGCHRSELITTKVKRVITPHTVYQNLAVIKTIR